MAVAMQRVVSDAEVKRGEVWLCDLGGGILSEQTGVRPCLIASNNIGNKFSTVVTIIPISSSTTKKPIPTHVHIDAKKEGLQRDSLLMTEQIRCIDKNRLMYCVGTLSEGILEEVKKAINISLAL